MSYNGDKFILTQPLSLLIVETNNFDWCHGINHRNNRVCHQSDSMLITLPDNLNFTLHLLKIAIKDVRDIETMLTSEMS